MKYRTIEKELLTAISPHAEAGGFGSKVFVGPPQKICSRVARLVVMQKGQVLHERISWSNMVISVLHGSCEVRLPNCIKTLRSEESFAIPANEPHEIKSLTFFRAVVSFDASTQILAPQNQ